MNRSRCDNLNGMFKPCRQTSRHMTYIYLFVHRIRTIESNDAQIKQFLCNLALVGFKNFANWSHGDSSPPLSLSSEIIITSRSWEHSIYSWCGAPVCHSIEFLFVFWWLFFNPWVNRYVRHGRYSDN